MPAVSRCVSQGSLVLVCKDCARGRFSRNESGLGLVRGAERPART